MPYPDTAPFSHGSDRSATIRLQAGPCHPLLGQTPCAAEEYGGDARLECRAVLPLLNFVHYWIILSRHLEVKILCKAV